MQPSDSRPTPLIEEETEDNCNGHFPRDPSPVPTEIIDLEPEPGLEPLPPPDWPQECRNLGISVHDYAYDAKVLKAPSIWKPPLLSLAIHDTHIRRPGAQDFQLDGMALYRLLEMGWVTEEEAKRYWTEEDCKRRDTYKNQPGGLGPLVVVPPRNRPTRKFRNELRNHWFPREEGDIPDSEIWQPDDLPDSWGGEGHWVLEDIALSNEHVAKKARLEADGDTDDKTYVATPLNTPQNSFTRTRSASAVEISPAREPSPVPTFFSQPVSSSKPTSPRPRSPRPKSPLQRTSQLGRRQRGLSRNDTILTL